jgi:hypothetical protein
MDEPIDLPLDETRAWLTERAHGRFRRIPAETIAEHVLRITPGADFPVRRAALEALQRRMQNVDAEGLAVLDHPARGWLGRYVLARTSGRGRARKVERCPYDSVLDSARTLQGRCGCADYIKGSLAMCKHLLAVLAHVYETDGRRDTAFVQDDRRPSPVRQGLSWDPLIPLRGPSDRLARLRFSRSKDGVSVRGFLRDGRIDAAVISNPEQCKRLLEHLAAETKPRARSPGRIAAGPDVRALLHWELEHTRVEALARSEAAPAMRALSTLKRTLYPYQIEGVRRFFERGRLLLADDMGLGKTTQAIAICHALVRARRIERGLIIVPSSLKSQWLREWHETTDLPATVIDGNATERHRLYRTAPRGFMIASYELLLRDFDELRRFAHEFVVLDEAQRIKNYATKSAVYVKALPAVRRLVLTGTPMENRLDELASIMDWVDDRVLAPKWRLPAWHIRYEGDGMKERVGARNLDTLRERIAGPVVRRIRSDVLKQLPARTDTRVPVSMTPEQREEATRRMRERSPGRDNEGSGGAP